MAQTKNKKSTSSGTKKTTSKSTGRNSRTVKKTTRSSRNTKKNKVNVSQDMKNEVGLILFFVFCVLMFLSCFGVCGSFGTMISNLLFGLFGALAYVIPVALFAGVCYLIARGNHFMAILKFAAGVAVTILLSGYFHMFSKGKALQKAGEIYEYCALHHSGGGVLGGSVYRLLSDWLGIIGAVVVMAALIIIAVVIISEKSFVGGVKKSSKKVYDVAKTENEKMKERAEERRERKRNEEKPHGVGINISVKPEQKMQKELPKLPEIADVPELSDNVLFGEEMESFGTIEDIPNPEPVKMDQNKKSSVKDIPVKIAGVEEEP